ncbi:aldo/keto reductase [Clostridium folliculivorans]|uniref:Oxidoreductase n=1 Tax=Clostridium folliculivorans TaxID=2886038 RepID=A0A9W5Y1U2_9CLOT|nr:aldo/keto reductase [Clostridium folliculivorans]GKU25013.1 oxidoreductase [Clostridium folliculivorans]GKU31111.1 oxidoreductase [Clostridium folliculivorans]
MIKRKFGNTGFEITPVIYGGIVSMRDGQEASDNYVSWAIDRGINYFDVAPSYEDAQEKLGKSLIPYRKNIYLACKTTCRMKVDAQKEFEESFRMLHTDYLDVYQMHALSKEEDVEKAFGSGGVMEMMVKAKEQGVVRKLGITCHNEAVALKAMSLYDFDTVLFPLNWHMNLGHDMGTKLCKTAKEKGMGLVGMKQLIERAWLNGDEREKSPFPKSWCKPIDLEDKKLRIAAMKYTLSLGVDALVPPGDFVNFSFVVENIDGCLKNPLNDEDLAFLRQNYEKVKEYPFFKVQI